TDELLNRSGAQVGVDPGVRGDTRVGRLDVSESTSHGVMLVDPVDEDQTRFARSPGMLGDIPEDSATSRVCIPLHELIGHEDRDVEGRDVALVPLPLQVLGGYEVLDIRVRYRDGGHAGAASSVVRHEAAGKVRLVLIYGEVERE